MNALSDSVCDPDPNSRVICFADTRRHSAFVQEFDGCAQALSSVSDIGFNQIPGWLEEAYKRSDTGSVTLAGVTEHLLPHIPAHEGVVQLSQPVNANMIAYYAARALSRPDQFPHADFSPLYVVSPKLGSAKSQP